MIYIPTGFLKPNMVLARDISAYGSMFALLNKGQKLTASLIERLVSAQIPGVYIENGIAVVDREKCVACGKCVAACPKN